MEYVTLNNKLECPVVGIGTFMLSPADAENSVREALRMAKIAELDKNERYYHRTDEQLVQFAGWRPDFEKG